MHSIQQHHEQCPGGEWRSDHYAEPACHLLSIQFPLQEPITDFRQRVAECNACISYSGIASNARVEDGALTAVLSLLPMEPPAGANPPPPSTQEAIRTINILQCLQRLVTSASVAAAVVQTPGLLLPASPMAFMNR